MSNKIDEILEKPAFNKLKELLKSPGTFIAIYLVIAALTYILPYYEFAGEAASGLNSFADAMNEASGGHANVQHIEASGGTIPFILHILALSILVLITYIKAKEINKSWIVILPALAFGFDILPLVKMIPFIPTGLHIATIILGAKGEDKVVYVEAQAKEEPKNDD